MATARLNPAGIKSYFDNAMLGGSTMYVTPQGTTSTVPPPPIMNNEMPRGFGLNNPPTLRPAAGPPAVVPAPPITPLSPTTNVLPSGAPIQLGSPGAGPPALIPSTQGVPVGAPTTSYPSGAPISGGSPGAGLPVTTGAGLPVPRPAAGLPATTSRALSVVPPRATPTGAPSRLPGLAGAGLAAVTIGKKVANGQPLIDTSGVPEARNMARTALNGGTTPEVVKTVAGSPLARGLKAGAKGLMAGAALPFAAVNDVGNKVLNAGNALLGGDADYFRTDLTSKLMGRGLGVKEASAESLPVTKKPVTSTTNPDSKMGPGDLSRLSDGSLPVPTAPKNIFSGESPVISLGKPLGDTTAISDRVDWSPGSKNVKGLAAAAKYAEEVAQAEKFNAAQGAKTLDQQLTNINSGNTTWSLPKEQREALALGNFKRDLELKDLTQKSEATAAGLEAEKIKAGLGLSAAQVTAQQALEREIASATIKADGDVKAAKIKAEGDKASKVGTEKETEMQKELAKAKVAKAVEDAVTMGSSIEEALANREAGLKPKLLGNWSPAPNRMGWVGADGKEVTGGADVPAGYKQVGTSKGKPVYENATGKRFIGA